MRTFFVIFLAAFPTLLVALGSSILIVQAVVRFVDPKVFSWEGAEGFLPLGAAQWGGIVGWISAYLSASPAASRRSLPRAALLGFCVGAALSFPLGLSVIASGSPKAPEGMWIWSAVTIIVSGSLAGMVGGLVIHFEKSRGP